VGERVPGRRSERVIGIVGPARAKKFRHVLAPPALARDTGGRPARYEDANCPQAGDDGANTGRDREERSDSGHEGESDRETDEEEYEESSDVLQTSRAQIAKTSRRLRSRDRLLPPRRRGRSSAFAGSSGRGIETATPCRIASFHGLGQPFMRRVYSGKTSLWRWHWRSCSSPGPR
jgi:hypothetical protein